jgi:hypothetical protein
MRFLNGLELAYCTNVHRGNTWEETFDSLERYVLSVREKVWPGERFAIGLRLGADAARELSTPEQILRFQKWLESKDCYVFTINGFPYGNFHGQRVKEEVYRPDWATEERLTYTVLLFEILEKLLQPGEEGSVSTLPGSFKEFHPAGTIDDKILENLIHCSDEIERIKGPKNLDLHLGLEPEPLGLFETTPETVDFFNKLRKRADGRESLLQNVGVNYDCCHLAVEFEEAEEGLNLLDQAGIRLSKLHLSSALRVTPSTENLKALSRFVEEVYLHQVVIGQEGQVIRRYKDLDLALKAAESGKGERGDEWRIHFHVPLHASPGNGMEDTRNHVRKTLDWLARNPEKCRHLEMETYTWEVLPESLRSLEVIDQVAEEYFWTLNALSERGLAQKVSPQTT